MIDMLEATPCLLNESASLLPYIAGEVLGVAVEAEQLLILPTDDAGAILDISVMSGDVDGDGEEDEPIVVTGERFETDFSPLRDDGTGGGSGGGGYGGTGGGGSPSAPPPDPAQDCTDRSAIAAKADIRAEPDDDYKEHAVISYRAADGTIQRSPPIEGEWGFISVATIQAWMQANGVTFQQVTGMTHNHDPYHYGEGGEWGQLNGYPSGGHRTVTGTDWNAADWFVNNGVDPATFSLYVIDPQGHEMREFHYRDKAYWAGLNFDQRKAGTGLPAPLVPDGSTCG